MPEGNRYFNVNGETYSAAESEANDFLKENPNAQEFYLLQANNNKFAVHPDKLNDFYNKYPTAQPINAHDADYINKVRKNAFTQSTVGLQEQYGVPYAPEYQPQQATQDKSQPFVPPKPIAKGQPVVGQPTPPPQQPTVSFKPTDLAGTEPTVSTDVNYTPESIANDIGVNLAMLPVQVVKGAVGGVNYILGGQEGVPALNIVDKELQKPIDFLKDNLSKNPTANNIGNILGMAGTIAAAAYSGNPELITPLFTSLMYEDGKEVYDNYRLQRNEPINKQEEAEMSALYAMIGLGGWGKISDVILPDAVKEGAAKLFTKALSANPEVATKVASDVVSKAVTDNPYTIGNLANQLVRNVGTSAGSLTAMDLGMQLARYQIMGEDLSPKQRIKEVLGSAATGAIFGAIFTPETVMRQNQLITERWFTPNEDGNAKTLLFTVDEKGNPVEILGDKGLRSDGTLTEVTPEMRKNSFLMPNNLLIKTKDEINSGIKPTDKNRDIYLFNIEQLARKAEYTPGTIKIINFAPGGPDYIVKNLGRDTVRVINDDGTESEIPWGPDTQATLKNIDTQDWVNYRMQDFDKNYTQPEPRANKTNPEYIISYPDEQRGNVVFRDVPVGKDGKPDFSNPKQGEPWLATYPNGKPVLDEKGMPVPYDNIIKDFSKVSSERTKDVQTADKKLADTQVQAIQAQQDDADMQKNIHRQDGQLHPATYKDKPTGPKGLFVVDGNPDTDFNITIRDPNEPPDNQYQTISSDEIVESKPEQEEKPEEKEEEGKAVPQDNRQTFQEKVGNYTHDIAINPDGSLDVLYEFKTKEGANKVIKSFEKTMDYDFQVETIPSQTYVNELGVRRKTPETYKITGKPPVEESEVAEVPKAAEPPKPEPIKEEPKAEIKTPDKNEAIRKANLAKIINKDGTLRKKNKGNPNPFVSAKAKEMLSNEATSPEEAVLHYFLGGGRVNTEDFKQLTGYGIAQTRGKRAGTTFGKKEFNSYLWAVKNNGPKIDTLHEVIGNPVLDAYVESNGSRAMENLVWDILSSNSSRKAMEERLSYLQDQSNPDARELTDEDIKSINDYHELKERAEIDDIEQSILKELDEGKLLPSDEDISELFSVNLQDHENEQQRIIGLESQVNNEPDRQIKAGSVEGTSEQNVAGQYTPRQKQIITEADSKLKEIADQERQAQSDRENKLAELSKRNDLFAAIPNEENPLEVTLDVSSENVKKILQPFDKRLLDLQKERENIIANRDRALNEPETQMDLFGEKPEEFTMSDVDKLVDSDEVSILCTDDFGNIIKAEEGMDLGFTPGSRWDILTVAKGATHKHGGIPISVTEEGKVMFRKGDADVWAENGVVIKSKRNTYSIRK